MNVYCKINGIYTYTNTEPYFTLEECEARIAEATEEELNNLLKRPSDFGWFGDEDMFDTWSLGPVYRTRDSSILEESNADMFEQALEESAHHQSERSGGYLLGAFDDADYYRTGARHSLCGWVNHMSCRVFNDDGTYSPIVGFIYLWFDMLSEHCVANDEDYYERQYQESIQSINDSAYSYIKDDVPDDWAESVYSLMKEPPDELYSRDDEVRKIVIQLGYMEES